MRSFFLALVIFVLASTAEANCPVSKGQKVIFEAPDAAYLQLTKIADGLEKGEFETTSDFEKRKADVEQIEGFLLKSKMRPNGPNARNKDDRVTYNADFSRFEIQSGAWDTAWIKWEKIFQETDRYGSKKYTAFGVGLENVDTQGKSYLASNLKGQSALVTKVRRKTYGVFDKFKDRTNRQKPQWIGDATIGDYNRAVLHIPSPTEEAKLLKDKLQIGIYFVPKFPYATSKMNYQKPSVVNPNEVTEEYRVMVGNIKCAVVADESGKVLAVANTGY